MDTIEFRLTCFEYGADDYSSSAVDIFINGENLLPRIHEFEESVGCYGGHAPLWIEDLHKNLVEDYKNDSIPIYGCVCGVIDCSAIYISVEVGAETVVWKNFILPDENLRGELIYQRKFGEFVFDKAQYFREVEKLKLWRFNDKLIIEYGSIDCGFVDFNFMKNGKLFNFAFDELLGDPFPQLVNLFLHIQRGEPCTENFGDTYDDRITVLKISVRNVKDEVFLTAEIVSKKILLTETYRREELAAMFKKIFDDLLNDKYFPYSYPCFSYLGEDDEDNFDKVTLKIEAEHPDWTTGDVWNYAAETGQVKLAPCYEKYLEHYKKMLTEFIIPEKWFE